MSNTLITLLLVAIVLILLGIGYYVRNSTLWLIARTKPYEQRRVARPQLLVFGDSTGYGTGGTKDDYSVAGLIGRTYDVSVFNKSSNGQTIKDALTHANNVTGSYQIILLQIGANDILQKRSVTEAESELRKLVSHLNSKTSHLIMMSSGNVGGAPAFSNQEAAEYEQLSRTYRQMFLRVAADTELKYIDLFAELEHDPFVQDPDLYVAADGLHPSDKGYESWFKELQETLHPILVRYEKTFAQLRN